MKLTDAEWHIMNALWKDHPATAREIAERLPAGVNWAYTTVKTLLARLLQKNAVSERKRGNASVYEPILTQDKARRGALRSLVNHAFSGAFGPLMLFLAQGEKLSEKDRKALVEALKRYGRTETMEE